MAVPQFGTDPGTSREAANRRYVDASSATTMPRVGDWLVMGGASASTMTLSANEWRGQPINWPAATWDALAFEVTTAGTAGSQLKVVLFADNTGRPGSVVYDGAGVDAATTGVKTLTGLSIVTPGGALFAGVTVIGAPATVPQVRSIPNEASHFVSLAAPTIFYSATAQTYGVTMPGAASANPTVIDRSISGVVRLAMRRSA